MEFSGINKLIQTELKVIQREKDSICVAPKRGESYPENTIKLTFRNAILNMYSNA